MVIELDKDGQMGFTEDWHYKLLGVLEDMCSDTDKDKTIAAYMPEIIELVCANTCNS